MLNKLLYISFIILLSGCTTHASPEAEPFLSKPDTKATIYLYRPDSLPNSNHTAKVRINGLTAILLKSGEYRKVRLRPGEHSFTIKFDRLTSLLSPGKPALKEDFLAGEEYLVVLYPERYPLADDEKSGFFNWELTLIDHELAEEYIQAFEERPRIF